MPMVALSERGVRRVAVLVKKVVVAQSSMLEIVEVSRECSKFCVYKLHYTLPILNYAIVPSE